MNNIFDDIRNAISQAEHAQIAVDNNTDKMARLIKGRLKQVNIYILRKLKHELKDFNAKTGKWK